METLDRPAMGMPAGARMLIANPQTVDAYVRKIPKGQALSIPELRGTMAKDFGADVTCPLTTGIFLRIVSELALEQMGSGKAPDQVTPFWRAVDPKSGVAKKLSCGIERLKQLRETDGIAG